MEFALAVRKQFAENVEEWEEYDGFTFSWGGDGLEPARKKRLVVRPVVDAVALEVLVEELKAGKVRVGSAPEPTLIEMRYEFELRTSLR
jgi:hypothetical protein